MLLACNKLYDRFADCGLFHPLSLRGLRRRKSTIRTVNDTHSDVAPSFLNSSASSRPIFSMSLDSIFVRPVVSY